MKTKTLVRVPLLCAAFALALCLLPAAAHAYTPFDTWYGQAKSIANTADHVIGNPDSGISKDSYTIVMPGETIGVWPSASMNVSNAAVAAYATISYDIIQFEKPVADYSYLPRSAKPEPKLTAVQSATVDIPYAEVGEIIDWEDGQDNLKSFDYTAIYRNDTGLPILITYKGLGTPGAEKTGKAFIEAPQSYYVQGRLTITDGVTLAFLEPSYQISQTLTATDVKTGKELDTADLYWDHGTNKSVVNLPKSYEYAKNGWQSFTLPHPIMKGYTFGLWRSSFVDEDGFAQNHPLGAPLRDYTRVGYEVTSDGESTTYRIDFPLTQNKSWVSYVLARDISLTAQFSKSDSSHTIGFHAQGGTVNGMSYYICEDVGFKLDVSTVVPVWAGHSFKGWCTDPEKPAATLVEKSGTGDNVYGTTADANHTELYAVWDDAGENPDNPDPDVPGPVPPQPDFAWERLAGDTALDTMVSIGKRGFPNESSERVVLATDGTYHDALSAAGLAGLYACPVLLTSAQVTDGVSPQTAAELKRLGAKTIYVCGGSYWIPETVLDALRTQGYTVERLAGEDAAGTALKIYEKGKGQWGSTAIVATVGTYHDALAAGPYAYAKAAPIFLTSVPGDGAATKLSDATVEAIKGGGFERTVLCGGAWFLDKAVEGQLEAAGFKTDQLNRIAGANACATSSDFAEFCLSEGMTADGIGLATSETELDALAGAAFCGKNNAPLLLASNNTQNDNAYDMQVIDGFLKNHAALIDGGFLFGGEYYLPASVKEACEAATR